MKKLLLLLCLFVLPAQAQTYSSYDASIPVPMTVTASAYVASKSLGGLYTVPIYRYHSAGAKINYLSVRSASGTTPTLTAYVFNANPTNSTCTDLTAFSLNAADVTKLVATFPVTLAAPQGSTPTVGVTAMNLSLSLNNYDTTIQTTKAYFCIVVGSGGVTPASTSDFSFMVGTSAD